MHLLRDARNNTGMHFRADDTAHSSIKTVGVVSLSVGCVAIECSIKVTIVERLVVAVFLGHRDAPLALKSLLYQSTSPVTFAGGNGCDATSPLLSLLGPKSELVYLSAR